MPKTTGEDLRAKARRMTDPADWLYTLGRPRYWAEAFGDYYYRYCEGMTFSAAKIRFDYDPRGHALYREYGGTPVGAVVPQRPCEPGVEYWPERRYAYIPVCGCGWRHTWGYVAEHAARQMADAHRDERNGA